MGSHESRQGYEFFCEMDREANEICYVKFVSYKCPSLGEFEKGKLPFTCEGSHVFLGLH
jgi:hypothetical protein